MDRGSGTDPFAGLKEDSGEYTVYDSHYEKIGKVDDLVLGKDDRVLYVGVKMGFLGTSSTLVPVEIIRVNDRRQLIEVSEPAETVKHAPHFGRNEDLTPELENHVRTYFGLDSLSPSPEHEPQGPDILEPLSGRSGSDDWADTVPIYHVETEENPENMDREPRRPARGEPIRDEPVREGPRDQTESIGRETREEDTPERVGSRQRESRRPARDEPIRDEPASEGPGDQTESRWESSTSGSGLTVHRLRR